MMKVQLLPLYRHREIKHCAGDSAFIFSRVHDKIQCTRPQVFCYNCGASWAFSRVETRKYVEGYVK